MKPKMYDSVVPDEKDQKRKIPEGDFYCISIASKNGGKVNVYIAKVGWMVDNKCVL